MHDTEILDLFCNTADGVFAVRDQRIIRWNKGAEKILKYSATEVLNRECYKVVAGRIHPDKIWCSEKCRVQNCVSSGGQLEDFDLLTQTAQREPVWVNVSTAFASNGGQPLTVHFFRDITREKKAGQAIETFLSSLGISGVGRDKLQDAPVAARTSSVDLPLNLSVRELEVLTLLAEGLSTKGLAERLNISHFTARNHIQNILVKLDLHSKAQAVSYAFKKGLL
jgi:PAS domain S-box-containing protein